LKAARIEVRAALTVLGAAVVAVVYFLTARLELLPLSALSDVAVF